jgi:hypothetical protein
MWGRIGRWAIIAAVLVALVLIVGLGHDFTAAAGQQWFTTRPALVGTLVALGWALMLIQRYANRRATGHSEEEEE